MKEIRMNFETKKSLSECAATFRQGVQTSYGGVRKLMRGSAIVLTSISNSRIAKDTGGVEYFEIEEADFMGKKPDWQLGVMIPGYSKFHGASRMAVHIYVTDLGEYRGVELVGPLGLGDRGSTQRIMEQIVAAFK